MMNQVILERDIMASTVNHSVVELYYAFDSEVNASSTTSDPLQEYLFLVMEYMIGGDLGSLLKNMGTFPEEMSRRYIAEILLALEYLHSIGIVHRDLKPGDITSPRIG